MEPELSMTNTISRGRRSSPAGTGGRRHEGEHIVGVADALAEQADRRQRAAVGRLPGQLEVAIRRHRAFGELDDARRRPRPVFRRDGVVVALHLGEREAGLQAHGDGDRIDRRVAARIEHRRRDAVAIRHRVGRLAPTLPVGARGRRSARSARACSAAPPPAAPAARTRCRTAAPAPGTRSAPPRSRAARYWRPNW